MLLLQVSAACEALFEHYSASAQIPDFLILVENLYFDQVKQGILFGLKRSLVCLCACVCLGHTPLPIAIEFGINGNGTNLEGRVFKNFVFPSHFKTVAVLRMSLFHSYGQTHCPFLMKFAFFRYYFYENFPVYELNSI